MDKILSELSSSLKQILKVKIPTHLPYLILEATDNEEWFRGNNVCEILGFINDIRLKGVKQSHKTDVRGSCQLNLLSWRQNIYISAWSVDFKASKTFKKVKKAYKTSLYAVCDLESLLEPGNEDRAVDEWNKWTTLHMM